MRFKSSGMMRFFWIPHKKTQHSQHKISTCCSYTNLCMIPGWSSGDPETQIHSTVPGFLIGSTIVGIFKQYEEEWHPGFAPKA